MQEKTSQERFKTYLRKIGSGEQTSRNMTREESADALNLNLTGIPSPAQIGAFMIAHRIKRPGPEELAGMIDTYLKLGPKLQSQTKQRSPICFGMPFDGRTRTAPIYPLTSLVLLSAEQPVVLQGGQRMPVKYGITTQELFFALGMNLSGLTISQVQSGFLKNNFAFIHQPEHFPLAENLIYYRDQIGKRPPIASMELLWSAHRNKHLLVSGFVHNPTEERHWKTLQLIGEENIITIKGLEGSTDLPVSRKCQASHIKNKHINALTIDPKDYNFHAKDVVYKNLEVWKMQAIEAINNKGPLIESLLLNAGFYLWSSDITSTLQGGVKKAENLIKSGSVKDTIDKIINWRQSIKSTS